MKKKKYNFYERMLLKRILKKAPMSDLEKKYYLSGNTLNDIFEKCETRYVYLTYNEIELLLWMYNDYRYKLIELLESRRRYFWKSTPSQKNAFLELSDHVGNVEFRTEELRDLIKEYEYICPSCNYKTDDTEIKHCIKCGSKLSSIDHLKDINIEGE